MVLRYDIKYFPPKTPTDVAKADDPLVKETERTAGKLSQKRNQRASRLRKYNQDRQEYERKVAQYERDNGHLSRDVSNLSSGPAATPYNPPDNPR